MSVNEIDEGTRYTICRMIGAIGFKIRDDWDWNWLEEISGEHCSEIDELLWRDAWKALLQEDWLSLQTTNERIRRITTILPLGGLINLRSLVLQENHITDLKPLSGLSKLRYLSVHNNRVVDLSPLQHLRELEDLHVGENPVESLAVLEELPTLRELHISTNQVDALAQCKSLRALQLLDVSGDGGVSSLANFPEMPSLRVLRLTGLRDISGVARFPSLGTLELLHGSYSTLADVKEMRNLTHFTGWTNASISVEPFQMAYRLRSLDLHAPEVLDLSALSGLPVLHEINLAKESKHDRQELEVLRASLTPWSDEFRSVQRKWIPSTEIEVVSDEEFEVYDTKKAFGVQPAECYDGMFLSERGWIMDELTDALGVHFEEGTDFDLPWRGGFRRSHTLVLYTLRAYESFREIAMIVQNTLCQARNQWIIYTQALLDEGPDAEELPEETNNFIVWLYPNKIVAREPDAKQVARLISWS